MVLRQKQNNKPNPIYKLWRLQMQKNVGTLDAFLRITFGLFGLAWGVSKMVRHPHRGMPVFITFQSAMKAAEGFFRFCPLLALMNTTTIDKNEQERKMPYSTTFYARRKTENPPAPEEEKKVSDE
jgi:hypothetical protein